MAALTDGVSIFGVEGLGEIVAGDDLAELIAAALGAGGRALADGDVVVVTSKVVSKAEGAGIELADVTPSAFATRFAEQWGKDARVVEVVLQQARRIVRMQGPVLITETHHGLICANSGVDQSSSGAAGRVLVLPSDPDASARRMRATFAAAGLDVGVIVSDTFGRPWRIGQTDIAIGVAGLNPIRSYVGEVDPHGHVFQVQELCVADELTAAAELVKGNTARVPAAVIRGYAWEPSTDGAASQIIRDPAFDLFR